MSVTVASFRGHFNEFASGTRFPNALIEYWAAIAAQLVSPDRWGNLTDVGIELFVAHNLSLERRALDEAARGATPGASPGIVSDKAVDKVKVGYDTQGGAELGAGHWNLTIYGTRYIRLARMMGAGPVQVGIGSAPAGTAVDAYQGPWYANFPNMSG